MHIYCMIGLLKMRKYQQKLASELSYLYQSNDPLKWVHIATITNVNREMTDREKKILFIRLRNNIIDFTAYVKNTFGLVLNGVQKAIASFADVMKKYPSISSQEAMLNILDNTKSITAVGGRAHGKTFGIHGTKVIVDELTHLSDDRVDSLALSLESIKKNKS